MKRAIWTADWFVGLLVSLAIGFAAFLGSFQGIERAAYDWGVRGAAGVPSDQLAILEIDERAIANMGRWPWPRSVHAQLIEMLSAGEPKGIAYTVFFIEPQQDPGLAVIDQLVEFVEQGAFAVVPREIEELDGLLGSARQYDAEGLNRKLVDLAMAFDGSQFKTRLPRDIEGLRQTLSEAQALLDADSMLVGAAAHCDRLLLPFTFQGVVANPIGRPDEDLPPFIGQFELTRVTDRVGAGVSGALPLTGEGPLVPIAPLGDVSRGIGHLTTLPDVDGAVRNEPLVLEYDGAYFPSFAMIIAANSLNLGVSDIEVRLGEGIRLGGLSIDTDTDLQMRTAFYPPRANASAFSADSIFDVISGKVPVDKFRGKTILIGPTAAGLGDSFATPISPVMTPVELLAHTVSSILQEDFFVRPVWARALEILVFILVALYLCLLIPRLRAGFSGGITIALGASLVITGYLAMTAAALWLQLMTPLVLLVVGYLVLVSKKFFVTERGKERLDLASAEDNRMLGLQFQGQGQLDMAFEKFRKVPLGDEIMETLYHLSLDYERKRQFAKAQAVYQYMSEQDPKFRDIAQRMGRAKKLEETLLLGGATLARSSLILDGANKPMLGRYEVEKELGKGAMGVVYLGRDPKINRVVAIKTMSLSQEFEEDELGEIKERFYREAETAGRLNHPNIVTIYDAGEEQDLAYIAMEFLSGQDLTLYTKPDKLLPVRTTMRIVIKCAEALAYAHQNNVVHRDIKPANIMFDPKGKQLKVTDFGIARITDASRTKTGVVLGTPSYMSPEQLAGKKIDGRSDLFSLGVTLYQLLTGALPFKADSMASLMYKIANERHPTLTEVCDRGLPDCLSAVIDKAMAKALDQRYQSGTEMAIKLQTCLKALLKAQTKT